MFENPRWEDYDYEMEADMKGNAFEWLGNGLCRGQIAGEDTTSYLDDVAVTVDEHIKNSITVAPDSQPSINGSVEEASALEEINVATI